MYRRVLARAPLPRSLPALALSALPKPLQTKLHQTGCQVQFVKSHFLHKSVNAARHTENEPLEQEQLYHDKNKNGLRKSSKLNNKNSSNAKYTENDNDNGDDDEEYDDDTYEITERSSRSNNHERSDNSKLEDDDNHNGYNNNNNNNNCDNDDALERKVNVIYPFGFKASKGEAAFAFTPLQDAHSHYRHEAQPAVSAASTHHHATNQMIVAGLGNKTKCNIRDYRLAVTNAVRLAKKARCNAIVFDLNNVLPSSGNSECGAITITTEQDLFHLPEPLKEDEVVEKTACFAVTGAYSYNRLKTHRSGIDGNSNYEGDEEGCGNEEKYNNSLSSTSSSSSSVVAAADAITTTTTSPSKRNANKGKGRNAQTNKKGKGKNKRQQSTNVTRRRKQNTSNNTENDSGDHNSLSLSSAEDKSFSIIINSTYTNAINTGSVIGSCVNDCRNLGNLREDEGTPEFYAQWSQHELVNGLNRKGNGIRLVKLLRGDAIRHAGLNLLYNVGKGSAHEPYVVVLEYLGNRQSNESISLVGKGVTFDCGGLNIKPYGSMETMHTDMMGAATALCTLKAAATLQLPINLSVAVGFVENAIGPDAYFPSSILTSLNGHSVEIRNTDAEGRLVLADLLTYVQRGEASLTKSPSTIIDLATLTGAIVIGLGERRAGLFSNHLVLTQELMQSGMTCGEELWPMPIGDEHVEKMKRTLSDFTNAAVGRAAGSCTAAAFLSQFIEPVKLPQGQDAALKQNASKSSSEALTAAAAKESSRTGSRKTGKNAAAKGKQRGRVPSSQSAKGQRRGRKPSQKAETLSNKDDLCDGNSLQTSLVMHESNDEAMQSGSGFARMPKWAHLDIAGVADVGDKPKGFEPAGVSGFGVQLLMDYIRKHIVIE